MSIGVCYFPEHWPRERWETDIEQMADAGIEYVRMAEFSWSRLEPEPGEFDFEWLDTVVDLIADHGMEVVLCTPTASPPKWLVDRHPDMLQEERDGTVKGFGSRRHYCFNSDSYRLETERIVAEMADRYADHPAVVGWQTDNEYGCHGSLNCFCDDCAVAFRDWLREQYGSIEDLNESWGTTFWSQHHNSFAEIEPPRKTPYNHHPSRLLDYQRFVNDSVVEYNRLQTDLLREANDDWFVTHNFMFSHTGLDPFRFGDDLDFASWDVYPTGACQESGEADEDELLVGNPDQMGLNQDLYRCAAPGNFWIMEQQPGDINWPPVSPQPAEGAMRLWAHHAIAHGGDVVAYFRWRRCRQGQEQYHAGLRKQDGSPDRGYHDAKQAATDFADLDLGEVDAPVAIVVDHDSLWGLGIQSMDPEFDPWAHVETYYQALRGRGVQVDVVRPEADLDEYDAVVAPGLYLADDDRAAAFEDYVASGGDLLLTIRAGEKDPANQLHEDLAPGPLAETAGVVVDQHQTVSSDALDDTKEVTYRDGTYGFRTWAEWLDVTDASVDGEYTAGVGEGRAAIALREAGNGDPSETGDSTNSETGDGDAGSCAYVGVWPGDDLADALVVDLLSRAGVDHLGDRLPEKVRFAERGDLTWVFNFRAEPVTVDLDADADVRIGDETVEGYGFAVVDGRADAVSLERER